MMSNIQSGWWFRVTIWIIYSMSKGTFTNDVHQKFKFLYEAVSQLPIPLNIGHRRVARGGIWGFVPPFHRKILQFARVFEKTTWKSPLHPKIFHTKIFEIQPLDKFLATPLVEHHKWMAPNVRGTIPKFWLTWCLNDENLFHFNKSLSSSLDAIHR